MSVKNKSCLYRANMSVKGKWACYGWLLLNAVFLTFSMNSFDWCHPVLNFQVLCYVLHSSGKTFFISFFFIINKLELDSYLFMFGVLLTGWLVRYCGSLLHTILSATVYVPLTYNALRRTWLDSWVCWCVRRTGHNLPYQCKREREKDFYK